MQESLHLLTRNVNKWVPTKIANIGDIRNHNTQNFKKIKNDFLVGC